MLRNKISRIRRDSAPALSVRDREAAGSNARRGFRRPTTQLDDEAASRRCTPSPASPGVAPIGENFQSPGRLYQCDDKRRRCRGARDAWRVAGLRGPRDPGRRRSRRHQGPLHHLDSPQGFHRSARDGPNHRRPRAAVDDRRQRAEPLACKLSP